MFQVPNEIFIYSFIVMSIERAKLDVEEAKPLNCAYDEHSFTL